MKKFLFALILVIFISMFLTNAVFSQGIEIKAGNSSYTYQGTVYNLELNGLWVPTVTPCVVISGFAYVPLREVFQDYLGLIVGYDNATELAYVKDGSKLMEFSFKQQVIYQNGKKLSTDLTVASINGNIMVPLSKTTDYFGYTAGVKPDNKTLTIQWNNKSESGSVVKDTEVSGSVKKISYYAESEKEFIFIETSASRIEKQFVLQPMEGNPFYRICLQISETRIEKPGNLDVYAGSVQQVRFAQVENAKQIASIVTEVDHIPEYIVNKVTGGFQIAITSRKSTDNTSNQEKAPDATVTPVPTKSPEPEIKPEPTKTPESEVKPEPTVTPVPTKSPEPEVKPEPTQIPQPQTSASPTQDSEAPTPTPTQVPVVTPSPTVTPKPEQGIGNGAIRYTMDGDNCIILLDNVDLSKKTKEDPDLYKIEYRTIEKMLQIRMPLTNNYKTEVIPGNSILHGIISFSNRTRNEVNIRISGKNDLYYVVASNGDSGTKIILNPNKDFAYNPTPTQPNDSPGSTPTPVPTVTPSPVPTTSPTQPNGSPTPTPKPTVTPSPVPTTSPTQPNVSPTPTPKPSVTPSPTQTPQPPPTGTHTPTPPTGSLVNRGDGDRSGTLSFVAGTDKIIIETIALNDYKIFRLSNPSRIIIDMPQNLVDAREYNYPSDRVYSKIRTGQYETTTARMVIEANENTEWNVKKDENSLTVTFSNSGIKNLVYSNNDDNAALKLTSPGIKQIMQQNTNEIETEDDKKSGTFSFIFPGDAIDLGSGKMQIGNRIMKSVHTLTTLSKTYLVISRENSEAVYQLVFTESNDEAMIVLSDGSAAAIPVTTPAPTVSPSPAPSQPKENSGKLVVLDAGHGGSEPGATYGKGEKWYNLDITLKTAAILKEKGVNVKLTREKDEFIGLYERAEMANDWKADVFISIHNNAFFDKKISGTMTFFYTGSYKGKEYATIVQNDLLKNLGFRDIGVKSQNFVVIRDTKMPAVLVEIGCLSNDAERAKLDTEEYRLKAAQSLAESILKIVSK